MTGFKIPKRAKYFLLSNKYDFLAVLFNLVVAWIAFSFRNNQTIFVFSIVVYIISLLFVIYIRIREKDFYFVPLTKSQDADNWIGRGTFKHIKTDNCFSITNSQTGYIYSKCLIWSDYKFSFDFKISNMVIGLILRAVNLSNYIMLQFAQEGINPHIKVNGGWNRMEHSDSRANLTFSKNLKLDKWYHCKIVCEKRTIRITIFDEAKIIFDRHWDIPEGDFKFKLVQYIGDQRTETIALFPVDLDYGSVGFRCDSKEKGLVKNVLIEKI